MKKRQKEKNDLLMTEGPIIKKMLAFMIPLMAGQIFQQLYSTVDSLVVGNVLGSEGLAAIGASSQIVNVLIGFFVGMTGGMSVLVAQAVGSKDEKRIGVIVNTSLWFSLWGGLVVTVMGLVLSGAFLTWMNTPGSVYKEALQYLQIYFAGALAHVLYNIGASILRAVGDSKRPFYILVVSSAVNVVLDLLFVCVFHWGVAGAGIATLIAQVISAVMVLWMLWNTKGAHRIQLPLVRYNKEAMVKILRLGVPTGLQSTILSASNMLVQTGINGFGEQAMASWVIYWKIDNMLQVPLSAMINAAATYAAQNIGARRVDRFYQGLKRALLMAVGYTLVIAGVMVLFAGPLFTLFNDEEVVIRYGVMQSRIIAVGYWMLASFHIVTAFVRGLGDTLVPMLITLFNMCGIRFIYMMTLGQTMTSMATVYWLYPITWGCGMVSIVIYYVLRKNALMKKCLGTEA